MITLQFGGTKQMPLSKAKMRHNLVRQGVVVIQRAWEAPDKKLYPMLLFPNENMQADPRRCLSYVGGKTMDYQDYYEELATTRPWKLVVPPKDHVIFQQELDKLMKQASKKFKGRTLVVRERRVLREQYPIIFDEEEEAILKYIKAEMKNQAKFRKANSDGL